MRCSCIQTDNIQSGLLPLRPILSDPINHCPIRPNPIQHAKHFLIRIWSYPYYHMSSHPARSEPIRLATEPYSSAFALECGYTAPYIVQAQMKKHILAHVLSRPQLWWHPPPQPKAEVEPSTRTTMREITTIMITTAITLRANTLTRNTIFATCTVHTDTHTHTQTHSAQSAIYDLQTHFQMQKWIETARDNSHDSQVRKEGKHSQQKHLSISNLKKTRTNIANQQIRHAFTKLKNNFDTQRHLRMQLWSWPKTKWKSTTASNNKLFKNRHAGTQQNLLFRSNNRPMKKKL